MLASGCDQPQSTTRDVSATLNQQDTAGFDRAYVVRPFNFPMDHGPHSSFRDEWWYVTGNLDSQDGRRFGFQITFFRHGLRRGVRPGTSRWSGQDAWMAHFALTDVAGQQYHSFQRMSREAVDLAGAQGEPFKVWLDDWRLESGSPGGFPWRFHAVQDEIRLDLTFSSLKPPALQGEQGLSRKSNEPGNASYYYSMTRLAANGAVTLVDEKIPVTGLAWLDREWSTSMLSQDQAGWDWFSLQLDDGTDLMYFRMRRKSGEDDPVSSGSFIDAKGHVAPLKNGDVKLQTLAQWRSPGGYDYPSLWTLDIKSLGKSITVRPVVHDQEFRHDARYWEGAVDVVDTLTGEKRGRGYVELTGYAPGPVEQSGDN